MSSLLLALLLAVGSLHAAEPTPKQRKAESMAQEAQAALDRGDFEDAFQLARRALKKDEDNVRAHYVRGVLAELVGTAAENEADRKAALLLAQVDFTYVSQADPDGILGGLARGRLTGRNDKRPSLPVPEVGCPPEAVAAFDAAEVAFSRHDAKTAEQLYLVAVEACPTNPTWQVYLGDAYFVQNDRAEAIRRYERALVIDPCNWQAHRFLADQYIGAGNGAQAYAHLLDALSCNPNYAEARGAMGEVVRSGSVPLRWPDAPSQAGQPGAGGAWAMLAAERATAQGAGGSPMEAERAAVRAAIGKWRAAPTADPAFRLLSDAEAAGTLDAAIFALLLDAPLFPEFLTWREAHRGDLRAYIQTSLATWP